MNPIVGRDASPAYEVWNIQYATLTDKSPKDFSPIPGLAESWKGSADGRRGPTRCAPNLKWSDGAAADRRGRRLHDQPRRAGGVAELHLRRREPHRHGARPADRRPTSSVADPKLPTHGHVHPAQAHLGRSWTPRRSRSTTALDGVGSGPFTLEQSREGPVRALQGQPELLRRQAGGRPRRASASSTTPTRWWPRSSAGRDRRRRGRPGTAFHPAREGPGHRHRPGPAGRRSTSSRSTAARA